MSHLVMNYHELWKAYREKVKAHRADYLRKLDRLQPYADSKQGQEDIDKAKSDFDAALSALRTAGSSDRSTDSKRPQFHVPPTGRARRADHACAPCRPLAGGRG